MAIVMDNLAAHKTAAVKEKLRELGISWILVVPYSLQFNAIELPFGWRKRNSKSSSFNAWLTDSSLIKSRPLLKALSAKVKHTLTNVSIIA